MSAHDVDELVELLDKRTAADGERWDLYRVNDGRWGVILNNGQGDPLSRVVTAGAMWRVLELAIESKRLPLVPPRPTVYGEHDFEPVKLGQLWHARNRATSERIVFGTKTRAACVQAIARFRARREELAAEWDQQWSALVAEGVEGIDYVKEKTP